MSENNNEGLKRGFLIALLFVSLAAMLIGIVCDRDFLNTLFFALVAAILLEIFGYISRPPSNPVPPTVIVLLATGPLLKKLRADPSNRKLR